MTEGAANAQTLEITSPPSGTAVVPGERLHVVVDPQGRQFRTIAVRIQDTFALDFTAGGQGSPVTVPIAIPFGLTGPVRIQAIGETADGGRVYSASVTLSSGAAPGASALKVFPPSLLLAEGGLDDALLVEAMYPDGDAILVTQAPGMTYVALGGDGVIVTVSPEGIVNPVAVGEDLIRVQYMGLSVDVPVRVVAQGTSTSSSTTTPVVSSSTTVTTASTTTTTTLPPSSGEPLSGKKLQLKDNADPAKKTFSVQSDDLSLALGGGNGSADDPISTAGSTLRVRTAAGCPGGPCDTTYPLSDTWGYVGKPGENKGYKYKSKTGLIRSLSVKPGKLLKVTGKGVLGHALGANPAPVDIVVQLGSGKRYCLEFGGIVTFKPGAKSTTFKAKDAAAPATCPQLP